MVIKIPTTISFTLSRDDQEAILKVADLVKTVKEIASTDGEEPIHTWIEIHSDASGCISLGVKGEEIHFQVKPSLPF